jgi:hypothetical protein
LISVLGIVVNLGKDRPQSLCNIRDPFVWQGRICSKDVVTSNQLPDTYQKPDICRQKCQIVPAGQMLASRIYPDGDGSLAMTSQQGYFDQLMWSLLVHAQLP